MDQSDHESREQIRRLRRELEGETLKVQRIQAAIDRERARTASAPSTQASHNPRPPLLSPFQRSRTSAGPHQTFQQEQSFQTPRHANNQNWPFSSLDTTPIPSGNRQLGVKSTNSQDSHPSSQARLASIAMQRHISISSSASAPTPSEGPAQPIKAIFEAAEQWSRVFVDTSATYGKLSANMRNIAHGIGPVNDLLTNHRSRPLVLCSLVLRWLEHNTSPSALLRHISQAHWQEYNSITAAMNQPKQTGSRDLVAQKVNLFRTITADEARIKNWRLHQAARLARVLLVELTGVLVVHAEARGAMERIVAQLILVRFELELEAKMWVWRWDQCDKVFEPGTMVSLNAPGVQGDGDGYTVRVRLGIRPRIVYWVYQDLTGKRAPDTLCKSLVLTVKVDKKDGKAVKLGYPEGGKGPGFSPTGET